MKLAKDKKLWIPDEEMWQNWCLNYEIKHWKEVVMHLTQCRTALDIGAHVGIWTRRMAPIFEKVYAFEPIPKHIECHKENLKDYSNVVLNEIGLSNKEGTAVIRELDFNSGSSTLEWKKLTTKETKHKQRQTEINLKTLDSYELTNIDFIKMDVEGHEVSTIEGAKETLINNSPIIFIEVLHKELKKPYTGRDALKDLGYTEVMHVGSGNYIYKRF
jgi:FkbM family methyltransferase